MNEIKEKKMCNPKELHIKSRKATQHLHRRTVLVFEGESFELTYDDEQTLAQACQDVPGTREEKRAESVHKEKP